MTTSPTLTLTIPATSANLGIGFDCLGLALDLKAEVSITPADALNITGTHSQFAQGNNLLWISYVETCKTLGVHPTPLALNIDSPIPLTGGLGSSAMCRVGGVAAALVLHDSFSLDTALQLSATLEGHPDNTSAALLGGLVCSRMNSSGLIAKNLPLASDLYAVLVLPPYEVRTEEARKVLPTHIAHSSAATQVAHAILTTQALASFDMETLKASCKDLLHEPHRAQLIPDFALVKAFADRKGNCLCTISGSGATILLLCQGHKTAEELEAELKRKFSHLKTLRCAVDYAGLSISTDV